MKSHLGMKLPAILLMIGVLFIGLFSFVPRALAQGTTYTVQPNDTLGSIALAHRVTVQSLLAANPSITNPSRIFPGEKLALPAANLTPGESIWHGFTGATPGGTPVPVTGGTATYTVQPGDSLGSIALAHRVTVASLLAANPNITNPSRILTGAQLTIPAPNLTAGESIWHGFTSTATGATPVPVTGGGTPVPVTGGTVSPVAPSVVSGYHFVSPTNACGWGVHDGQVFHGKLYVSPGFNLREWLKFNPHLSFIMLGSLNPGLIDGPQPSCGAILLPSM